MAVSFTEGQQQAAYDAALVAVEEARLKEATNLDLSLDPFLALNRLPPQLSRLSKLQDLWLAGTLVVDLAPIAELKALRKLSIDRTAASDISALATCTGLEVLWLHQTAIDKIDGISGLVALKILSLRDTNVSDLSPLRLLSELQHLDLRRTPVRDLRPLLGLSKLGTNQSPGLAYSETPAARLDKALEGISQIKDAEERAEKTLAYLATLPPWPMPMGSDESILTVEAVLKGQSPLGWRFSPADGAMEVYAEAAPSTAMQEQLAKMSGERAQALKKALAGANHGLRGEALLEASRFADLMDDGSRPLSVRSVELWGSLVAIGGLLDGNDVGRVQGRDPLDLLSVEQRAALQTLLQIAGNFVRSYPDVKALDDSAGGFLRRSITVEMVGAMIEAALRAAYVTPGSAALMQHVAAIGGTEGAQADKAASVSVRGIANLIQTAALFVGKGSIKLAGAAALGAAGYVGKEAADHYDLDKAAFAYVELIRDKVGPFLSNMPPDEAAVLQSALNDAQARLNERARISTKTDDPEAYEQGRKRDGSPSNEINKS